MVATECYVVPAANQSVHKVHSFLRREEQVQCNEAEYARSQKQL